MNIQESLDRYRQIRANISQLPAVVDKVVSDNKDVLLSLNRDQMLLGRDADGNLFTPNYQNDPYFKTKAQADSYARMKYALEGFHKSRLWSNVQLFPGKPKNTPNLIVTGPFQNSMFILVGAGNYEIGSSYKDTPDIERKYNNKVFGLTEKSKGYFYNYFMYKILKDLIYGV